jgi:non-ribosomal peptide synthase protein (TIGR01720 family)
VRALEPEWTDRLLREALARLDVEIDELLLAALARTCAAWAAAPAIVVDLESHGRDLIASGVDVSRTVGWFTVVRPVVLTVGGGGDLLQAVRLVRQAVRGAPERGRHFGLLAYGSQTAAAKTLRELPDADFSFNYLGQLDGALGGSGLFRPAVERLGPPRDRSERRFHLFDIGARVVNGRLQVSWTYSDQLHRASTVEALASAFVTNLETLIDLARAVPAKVVSPADFPLAGLDDWELSQLQATIDAAAASEHEA